MFSNLLDGISDPLVIKDCRHRWVFVNEAFCQLVGYPATALLGQSNTNILSSDEARVFWEEDDIVLISHQPQQREASLTDAQGQQRIVASHKSVFQDSQGNTFVIATLREVTQQKQVELSLADSETRFRELLANVPGAIYRCHYDDNWTMVVLSNWVEDICGYPATDFIQNRVRTWSTLLHGDDQDWVTAAVALALEEQRAYELEYRIWHRDGSLRWIYEKGRGSFDETGNLQHLNGAMFDITARKAAEQQLRQSEATNRALIQAIPDLLISMDGDGTYRDVSSNIDLSVAPAESFQTGTVRTVYDVLPPALANQRMSHAAAALATGKIQIYEQEIEIRGELRHEEVRMTASGANQVLVIIRDISDRKRAETQLQQFNAELEQRVLERTQDLEASQQKLSLVIQQTPMAVIEWDPACRVQAWNRAAEKIFGYPAAEAIGQKASFIVQPEVQSLVDQIFVDLLHQQGGTRSVNTNLTREGRLITCEWYNTPIVDLDGEVMGMASLVLDITERERATAALRQSEAQMRHHRDAVAQLVRDRALEQLSFEQFVAQVLEAAAATLDASAGLWMVSRDGQKPAQRGHHSTLWCHDYYSVAAGHSRQPNLPLENLGTYMQALATERTIAIADITADPCTQNLAQVYDPLELGSVMALMHTSLWLKGEMVAVFCIESCGETARPWSLEEISFAGSLADLLTSEIEAWQRRQTELALQKSEMNLRDQAVELQHTLTELQRTQAQVIQSEKMSSLGQLVAGVAHEINNPVNFIYGNLTHARAYTDDLLHLLDLYQQEYPQPTAAIATEIQIIDLPFLLEDLPKLLNSMKVGADRIQEIVASLRTFSRMDEAEMKAVDIHAGLDSTLMILQNRIKVKSDRGEIQVVRQYGDLPPVECYAGQLNQVFMNILSNAIDALEEALATGHMEGESPQITLTTARGEGEGVRIAIANNGPALPESAKPHIFDPFFTTKPIGKGTGMGLSISYQIVAEKHGGTLTCLTPATGGTCFEITIPLHQEQGALA
ncbi:PAS domain S-box protein [Leptolyngbya sp. PCC 6406]|uniref:PAS domain S-box protein n=1 Tax=Leptolyngbya sp. PCC 6406 TaxID=1173264 RepID=UPI001CECE112|nr:PAS domain S-box protein [Leptolyngbya sp. PCC 6406]